MLRRSVVAAALALALGACGSSGGETTTTSAEVAEAAPVKIASPRDGAAIDAQHVTVRGTGEPGDEITHDGRTVTVDDGGRWRMRIPLQPGRSTYEFGWANGDFSGSVEVDITRRDAEAEPVARAETASPTRSAGPAQVQQDAYQALDDAAIAGDAAMLAAIDAALGRGGEAEARSKLRSSYRQARRAVDPLLLEDDVEGLMVAGNEIASALRTAQDLLARGDARGIVRQRTNLREARDALAAALAG
jgi:hypothetical protein